MVVLFVIVCFFLLIFFYYKALKKGFFIYLVDSLRLSKLNFFKKIRPKIKKMDFYLKRYYRTHPFSILKNILLVLLYIAIIFTQYYFILHTLKIPGLTFFMVFLIFSIATLFYLMPIPGAFGVLEGGHVFLFTTLGIPNPMVNGLAFALIIRAADITMILIGITYLSYFNYKYLKKPKTKTVITHK
jgi:uncharacterized membrane protein YbhN (UPF0104 family)